MNRLNKVLLLSNLGVDPEVNTLEGKTRTRSYEDKQGVKRYMTEIVG